jgi:putative oxidoreductase
VNVGLLVLRLVVGALFIGHGTQKLFGWFGGGGLQGTGQFFDRGGWQPGKPMAALAGMSEAGGGALLILGFLMPLGCAAIIGMMTSAALGVHRPNGMWNSNGGMEFPIVMAASGACLAFAGPGRFAIDAAIGWHLSGVVWGTTTVLVGIVAGTVVLSWRASRLRRARTHRVAEELQGGGHRAA